MKNKLIISILTTLVLIVLLCQTYIFNFFSQTTLGRLSLIIIICTIAYNNILLGFLSVLAIIIVYNINEKNMVYSYNYYEGFDVSGNTSENGNSIASIVLDDKIKIMKAKEDILKQQLTQLDKLKNANVNTSDTKTTTDVTTDVTTDGQANTTTEGFCMSDRELNILRGKQSNTLPVFNKNRKQPENIEPSDKYSFSGLFSVF